MEPMDETPDPADAEVEPALVASATDVSVRGLMLGSGPRFARDAFGPVLAFYVAWKLFGLVAGIVLATLVSVLAFRHERKNDRKGRMPLLSLGFVVVQGVIGLASRSATVYLAH